MLALGSGASARDYALVVGVSSYDDPRLATLTGAANDAGLFADLARRKGIAASDLTLLSDDGDAPTAQAIEQAFEHLLRRATPGDRALVVLSGHGVAMRDPDAEREDDGLTEAFLPGDAHLDQRSGRWNGAITDDAIAGWLDALGAKGGDILLVADFCESGGALRSGSSGAARPEPRLARILDYGDRGAGRIVALLASPQGQAARQGLGPPWVPLADQSPHGLLSLYTALALEEPALSNMGELADWVAINVARHSGSPPSVFVGDRSREPFFRGQDGVRGRQRWLAQLAPTAGRRQSPARLEVQAGSLAGLFEGAKVRVLDIAPGGEVAILRGRLAGVDILSAEVVPDPQDPDPRWLDLRRLDGSAALDGGTFLVELRPGSDQAAQVGDLRLEAMLAAARWARDRPAQALAMEIASVPGQTRPDGECITPGDDVLRATVSALKPVSSEQRTAARCTTMLVRVSNSSRTDRLVQLAAFAPGGRLLLLPDPGPDYHVLGPGEGLLFGYQLTDAGSEEIFALGIDADYPLAERRLLRPVDPLRSGGAGRLSAPDGPQAVSVRILVEG